MSFWDNNKDSIKSGSLAVLKGAGRATVAVSKAGYSAAKNHNNKKTNGKPSEGGEEEDNEVSSSSYNPPINYRDPKTFPPPPHHVAAYGRADPRSETVPPPPQQQQQQQYNQQYNQQQYNQQYQPQSSYSSLTSLPGGYTQEQRIMPSPPPLPQQQSYQNTPTPSNVPGASNPYYPSPQQQQQQQGYFTPQPDQPSPYQPPQQPELQYQPSNANPNLNVYQPPQQPYQQSQQYQQPQPSQSQFQSSSQYAIPQPSNPALPLNSEPPATPARLLPLPPAVGTIPVYDRTTPPVNSTYSQIPINPVTQPPVNYYNQQQPNQYEQPQPNGQAQAQVYPQPPARTPTVPGYEQQQVPQPPVSLSENQQPNPSAGPALHPVTAPSYNAYTPPTRTSTHELHSQSTQSAEQNVLDLKNNKRLPKPDEPSITEPKFKTNLMDFDLSKYGAPPPKARLTKEEEIKAERRKAEKLRLKQIKENSLQKAKEASLKSSGAYVFTPSSNSEVNIPSPELKVSNQIYDTESLHSVSSNPLPAYEEPDSVSDIGQSPAVPSLPHRSNSNVNKVIEKTNPTPFELPDITQFQPPPLAHVRKTDSNNSYDSNIQPLVDGKKKPPKPPAKNFNETSGSRPLPPPSINTKSSYIREPMKSPSRSFPSPSPSQSPSPSPSLSQSSSSIKKSPPPKPTKLSSSQLNVIAHTKLKKTPPPKPSKFSSTSSSSLDDKSVPPKPVKPKTLKKIDTEDSTVRSNASGEHIRELQARLGGLNFQ